MNEKKMDEVVADFRAQWSEDFRRAMEKEPNAYALKMQVKYVSIPNTDGGDYRFIIEIFDRIRCKSSSAICKPSDKVDILLGQAIAWARLNNIPLPKQLKPNRITTFKKLRIGKTYFYPNTINGKFIVVSKTRYEDDLIYTIYFPEKKCYDTISCKVYNSIDMNEKFSIC